MLRGVIILIVVLAALARGGSLRNLASVELRGLPLVFASFGLQLLIFTPFAEQPIIAFATAPLYLLSMALLAVWVWMNRQLHGIMPIAAGVLMNLAAIAANGGYMPVDPAAAAYAGRLDGYSGEEALIDNNSLASAENVRLWLLTDIFPVPAGIPLANVFSLGDILLTTGIGIFCYRTLRGQGPGLAARPSRDAGAPAEAELELGGNA